MEYVIWYIFSRAAVFALLLTYGKSLRSKPKYPFDIHPTPRNVAIAAAIGSLTPIGGEMIIGGGSAICLFVVLESFLRKQDGPK
jgi:hypothetical protein